jgi:hypothetical protein
VSKHTATPWKAQKPRGPQHAIDRKWEIVAPDPDGHGEMVVVGEHTGIECLTKENAEFIVRACNAHDNLLAACKAVLEHGTIWWQMSQSNNLPKWAMDLRDALMQARAAIAKAESLDTASPKS